MLGNVAKAQQSIPKFENDAQKQAWIESHPEQYRSLLKENSVMDKTQNLSRNSGAEVTTKNSREELMQKSKSSRTNTPVSRVVSNERYASEEEKIRAQKQPNK